ncbi:hypothetical protein OPQ81_003172 [Rhizoctonia solani]|nr:hypothetical protein OPQ81_003172 [Rhizoctonia solani]
MQRTLRIELARKCPSPKISIRRLSSRKHLDYLNEKQCQAVMFPPNTSLQVLAGPGTGKTRVLTARVADLILSHSHSPSSICAVTFTRKASREMKARLQGYLGAGHTEELRLGTFHSVCAKYLRAYGPMVYVEPNFLIWDEEECGLLLRYIAESLNKDLLKHCSAEDLYEILSILKEKTKTNPQKNIEITIKKELENRRMPPYMMELIITLLSIYSRVLRESNALDFTDLLSKGLDLFRTTYWPREISRLRHVLVDEFQDTSSLQYLIVKELFKITKGSVSVVGDPDQSIYNWRGADKTVFQQMKRDLPQTTEIFLEENYRSTASIIAAAMYIISQDKTRPAKSLLTSRTPKGPKPIKKGFSSTDEEEAFIAREIDRLVVKSHGVIGYGDFAILSRSNFTAGRFTQALKNAGIPCRQLPEFSLNDREEVKNLLAFLRLANNHAHTPMLIRAMTGPLGVDKKVITGLIGRSIKHNTTLFNVFQRLHSGVERDTNPSSVVTITLLIQIIRRIRALQDEATGPADLLHYIIEATSYRGYLMNEFRNDYSWRAKNVEQTIRYARSFKGSKEAGNLQVFAFLEFMRDLSRADNINTGKVTLLTGHSAKGLEWPIVFVPDVVDGVYPHLKSDNTDEERQLLYVACTRAQFMLYLTYSETKLVGRGDRKLELQLYESEFTRDMPSVLYQDTPPPINKSVLELFRKILGRSSSGAESLR